MKTFKKINIAAKTTLTLLVLATITSIGFYACKKPTEGINLLVSTSSLSQSPTLLVFANANTASVTALPASFAVTISGDGAKYVRTDGGGTNFKVSGGFLPLNLTADAAPSAANPIIFNVYAEVPGFAPVTRTISIVDTFATQQTIKLLEMANLPAGTSTVTGGGTLNAGASVSEIKFTTPTNSTLAENATLTIPAGTRMLDANGTTINASALSGTIIQYGTALPSFARIFPGGIDAANVLGSDGKTIPGKVTFISAGVLAINMTAGTTPVKGFSTPIQMTIELQNGLINFTTGNPVKAGETIPVWSMNEATGQWKSDGIATVALDANNKLAATANISHLSTWQTSWQNVVGQTSFKANTINIIPSNTPWINPTNYDIQIQTAGGSYLGGFSNYNPINDGFLTQLNLPIGVYYSTSFKRTVPYSGSYGFKVYDIPGTSAKVAIYNGGVKQAESAVFNPAVGGTINININTPVIPDTHASISILGECSNKAVYVRPSGWLYFLNTSTNVTTSVNVVGGMASIDVSSGTEYIISNTYDGTTYTSNKFTFIKSDFSFGQGQTGFPISGSAHYYPGKPAFSIKNTLSLSCTYTLTSCN